MQSVEVSAKSLDEAKKAAAEKLGVEVDRVEASVLEETKGLFGKTTVRVRAHVIEAAPVIPPAPAPAKSGGRGKKTAPVEAPAEPAVEAPAEPVAAKAEAPKGRGRGRAAKAEQPSAEAPASEGAEGEEEVQVVATQEDAEKLAELLRSLVSSADLDVSVKPTGVSGRYVNLELDGKDVAYLVGKHGEVLNAMQYLVNIIGNRKLTSGVRATLDGNDYRKRREDTLTQLAVNIAEQVKKRGEEAVLDALPAFERRIVHKALSTVDGIVTYSEGEEPNRRVVIAPAE
ncbi:MAG TPA: RNA-binding cell elongation regulator Jag/EloR [Fimbriimonas sp.]|nr:RNA-binding cell elongation regulator Jag/EloR [Fimbriimonas sp.]